MEEKFRNPNVNEGIEEEGKPKRYSPWYNDGRAEQPLHGGDYETSPEKLTVQAPWKTGTYTCSEKKHLQKYGLAERFSIMSKANLRIPITSKQAS